MAVNLDILDFDAIARREARRNGHEAARRDGACDFTVIRRVVLPKATGPKTAVFLLQSAWIWNDVLFSSVLGNRPETRSIMNALLVVQGSYASTGPNMVLTAALIASVPSGRPHSRRRARAGGARSGD